MVEVEGVVVVVVVCVFLLHMYKLIGVRMTLYGLAKIASHFL